MAGRVVGRAVVLNAGRLDLAQSLSWDKFQAAVGVSGEVRRYEATKTHEAACRVQDGDNIVVTKEMEVTRPVIDALPESVKLIIEAGTGYNNIDVKAASARGISVCSCPAYSTDAVSTMVMAHVLHFSCSLVHQQRFLWDRDEGRWARGVQGNRLPHFELKGRVLGLIGGRGTIGSRVTDLALPFGMRVLVSSRSSAPSGREGVEVVTLDELLERSDFVSVHCPLNDQTRGSIGREKLAKMKPTAYIINSARGAIIDQAALVEALREGSIAGAGLDVLEQEPPPPGDPLYELALDQRAVITPHVGWQRAETRQRLLDAVADNVEAFCAGSPTNVVNPAC